jgi:hemoglobin
MLFAQTVFAQEQSNDALFRALGGAQGVEKIVNDFVPLVLADKRISADFKDTNLKRFAKLLSEQICMLSGGPCEYSGDNMKLVHQGMRINNAKFNALVEQLQIAMDKSKVSPAAQNKLLAILAPMQRDIVTQ